MIESMDDKIKFLCVFVILMSVFLPMEKGFCHIMTEVEYTAENECVKTDLEDLGIGFNCAQYAKIRENASFANVKTIFLNNQIAFEQMVKTLSDKRKMRNADYSTKDSKMSIYFPYAYEVYNERIIQEMMDANQVVFDFFQLTDQIMPYLSSPEKEKKIRYRYSKNPNNSFDQLYNIEFHFEQSYFGIYFKLAYSSADRLLTEEHQTLQKIAPCWYYIGSDDKIRFRM